MGQTPGQRVNGWAGVGGVLCYVKWSCLWGGMAGWWWGAACRWGWGVGPVARCAPLRGFRLGGVVVSAGQQWNRPADHFAGTDKMVGAVSDPH